MSWLLELDAQILYAVNGLNTPFLDELMWQLSRTLFSIPLYLFFIYLMYKKEGWKFWKPLIAVLLVVVLADQISVQCFKEVVCRFRPSHTPGIMEHLHYYTLSSGDQYHGGSYGFVSSHAANTFGVATFMALFAKRGWVVALVLFWASAVSLSRVYLGVHFPTDILAGGALGALAGWAVYVTYVKFGRKYGWLN